MYEKDYADMLALIKEKDAALLAFLSSTPPIKPLRRSKETIIVSTILSRRISFAASRKIRAKLFSIVGDELNGETIPQHKAAILRECGQGTWKILNQVVQNGFQIQGPWTKKAVQLLLSIQEDTYKSNPVQWLQVEDKWIQRNLRTIDASCPDWKARLTALMPFTNLFIWTLWREKISF